MQDIPTSREFDENMSSGKTEYKDFSELHDLARQGCLTCRVFRAAIFYHHQSNNAAELLSRDGHLVIVDASKATSRDRPFISVRYPYKASIADFGRGPESLWGSPSPALQEWGSPKGDLRLVSTASVDILLGPPRPRASRAKNSMQKNRKRSVFTALRIKKSHALGMAKKATGSTTPQRADTRAPNDDPVTDILDLTNHLDLGDENLDNYHALLADGDSSTAQEAREKMANDTVGIGTSEIRLQTRGWYIHDVPLWFTDRFF